MYLTTLAIALYLFKPGTMWAYVAYVLVILDFIWEVMTFK